MDSMFKRVLVPGLICLVLILVLSVAMVGCGGSSTATTATGQVTTSSAPATGGSGGATVAMKNLAFAPAAITIKVGETVTWTNTDSTSHTVTGNKSEFDSGTLDPGKTFSFTFQSAGTVKYSCTIHPGMSGTVVVQ